MLALAILTLAVGAYFLFIFDKGNDEAADDKENIVDGRLDSLNNALQMRQETLQKETDRPADFTVITIDPKKNLFGESVIEGKIENRASGTSYKDFELMIYWQDEVGAVMDSSVEIIFEGLDPGENVEFKTKRKGPRKSKSIQVKLRHAKVVGG